jgi:hypothetical protein
MSGSPCAAPLRPWAAKGRSPERQDARDDVPDRSAAGRPSRPDPETELTPHGSRPCGHPRLLRAVPAGLSGGVRDPDSLGHLHLVARNPPRGGRAARPLRARFLSARRRPGVHPGRQPDERGGHHREAVPLCRRAGRPALRRACPGEHRRQPDLLGRVRRRARRCRRTGAHRDQGDEGSRLQAAVRRRRHRRLGDRRADLPALHPAHHLRVGDVGLGPAAARRRHRPGTRLRRDADGGDRHRRHALRHAARRPLAAAPRTVDRLLAGLRRPRPRRSASSTCWPSGSSTTAT